VHLKTEEDVVLAFKIILQPHDILVLSTLHNLNSLPHAVNRVLRLTVFSDDLDRNESLRLLVNSLDGDRTAVA